MNTINKLISKHNFSTGNASRIKYIVIHYVGALGGAKDNAQYYANGSRGASAHYFVGFNGEIWQAVEDKNIAWHCGGGLQGSGGHSFYGKCLNSNSIGIEMCVRKKDTSTMLATDKDWYFEDATVESTVELTKYLMKKYNVPADRVIRHYDVTGKICPNPYVYNTGKHTWEGFKKAITGQNSQAGDSIPSSTTATVTATAKKSVTEIAKEVIAGKWGNGADRKKRLVAAGYNYSEVQAKVNDLCGKKTTTAPAKKSIETIAKEVIKGLWGNGAERKKKIEAAGYNYNAVQKKVNELMKK